jgi:hypothetical protein
MLISNQNDEKYKEQWERTKRWYSKVKEIEKGVVSTMSDDDYLDIVYAFFLNCYHLKDWVKFGLDCKEQRKIEDLFNKCFGSEVFKVCADLANCLKHVELTKIIRIDPTTKVESQGVTILLQQPAGAGSYKPSITKYNWSIKSESEKDGKKIYDAFWLADECMKEWNHFFNYQ